MAQLIIASKPPALDRALSQQREGMTMSDGHLDGSENAMNLNRSVCIIRGNPMAQLTKEIIAPTLDQPLIHRTGMSTLSRELNRMRNAIEQNRGYG